ncbi:Gfo/Idh/MocA family oxidoreductase [Micromonospora sp. NPDC049282]|uniref:Gfo/Idh/MocA family oxidoreductase n=1 Tax=Micromonospora sp. NPDC049282 TaxID=3364269 RepID=UPI0037175A44
MSAADRLRVGLVGCGRIGHMYADHLAASGGAVISCHDMRGEEATALADRVGGSAYADVDRLLDTVDAVVVTSSTDSHDALVTMALERKLPTFCEKPLTLDLDRTRELGAAADRSGTPLWVGFQRHFDPGFSHLRDRVAAGDVGTLYTLRMFSHDASWPPIERLAASGSIFRDLMLHDFDMVRWLTGREVTEVAAIGDVLAVPELAGLHDYDAVAATLRIAGGGVAVLTAGRHSPLGYDVRIEVLGSRDCLTVGLDERTPMRQVTARGPDDHVRHRDYRDRFAQAYRAQLDGFLAAAGGSDADPRAGSWRDSYAALALAMAAERSVRTNAFVPPVDVA